MLSSSTSFASLLGALYTLLAFTTAAAIEKRDNVWAYSWQYDRDRDNIQTLWGFIQSQRFGRSRTVDVYTASGDTWHRESIRASWHSSDRNIDNWYFTGRPFQATQFCVRYTVDRAVYTNGYYKISNGKAKLVQTSRDIQCPPGLILDPPDRKLTTRSTLDSWTSEQYNIAETALKRNIGSSSNPLIPKGVVIASPSTSGPNYYFQWIRDASCVVEHLVDNYLDGGKDLTYIMDWIDVQKKLQRVDNPSGGYTTGGLGEPKFHVDNTAYNEPWGRPQRDGPALRANTLMKFATRYLNTDAGFVRSQLYDSAPTGKSETVIKADLDYVVSSWSQSSFDLWEEIQGQHYYTIIVSYRAMVEGAAFAQKLGDSAAAEIYKKTADSMLDTIRGFWSAEKGYIVETHGIQGRSGLDCGVLLGVLRAPYVFTPGSEQTLATTEAMIKAFEGLYPINQRNGGLGFGIGRYPEDTYDGVSTSSRGNPWFICTATVAHTLFAATSEFTSARSISVTPTSLALFKRVYAGAKEGVYKSGSSEYNNIVAGFKKFGDGFLEVVQRHAFQNGSLAEQFDREDGFNRGARDLTWSYEAVLGAIRARRAVN